MENANTSRERAVEAATEYDNARGVSAHVVAGAMVAKAIIYVGDRLSEGVIDRETTDALDSIRVEVGGMAQAMIDLGAEVANLPRGRRQT